MSLSPPQVSELIFGEDALTYHTVAASMLFFWDYCITFGQEVDLIWRRQNGFISVLFCLIRYLTFGVRIAELLVYINTNNLIHPSTSNCVGWIRFEVITGHLLYTFVEILLVIRVFVFYERNKIIIACLVPLILIQHAAAIVILALTVPKILVVPSPLPPNLHVAACLILDIPSFFSNYWKPAIIAEGVLFALMVARFIRSKRHAAISTPYYLVVFLRDGTWAFAVIFAVLLWANLAFSLTPQKGDISLTWIFTVMGLSGSRLILNLRSAAQEQQQLSLSYDTNIELSFMQNDISAICPERNIREGLSVVDDGF